MLKAAEWPLEDTPAYVFDADALAERIGMIRKALGPGIRLVYAVKANPFIIGSLLPLVDGLEVCSPGEERICRARGVPGNRLVLSGVYKEEANFSELMDLYGEEPVYTAESQAQAAMLSRLAAGKGLRVSVLLRLSADSQFGMDEQVLRRVVKESAAYPGIRIIGIHFFSGTQKKEKRIAGELGRLDGLLESLAAEWPSEGGEAEQKGAAVPCLEYGPGLAVSYFTGERPMDEALMLGALRGRLEALRFDGEVTLELGRFIAADCGTYLTRVVDTKCNDGQRYCIVDGGIHQVSYYGQNMAMKIPSVRAARDGTELKAETAETGCAGSDGPAPAGWTVCGSLCTTADVLIRDWPGPELAPGDVLAFEKTGAYAVTEGPALFLSRDLPSVYLKENGKLTRVRKHIHTEEWNNGTAD